MLDFTFVGKALGKLIERVPYSMMIVLISILVSTVMAILLTMVRIKKIKVLNGLVGIYLSFFRSTPGLIHILLIYYGLPLLLKPLGIVMNASGKGFYSIAALSFYSAANLTEIFRPAYLAIDKGQHEAALCVGLSGFQKEIRIILPQVLPIVLPAMGNAFIELTKDTSIMFVIGLTDIMGAARNMIANGQGIHKIEIYLAVGLIYLAITTLGNFGNRFLEAKCQKVRAHQ